MRSLEEPSVYIPELKEVSDICCREAKKIWGEEMEVDYDVMLNKVNDAETAWHQGGIWVYFKILTLKLTIFM